MNVKLAITVLATGVIAALSPTIALSQGNQSSQVQFICAEGYDPEGNRYVPTTFAWTERGKIPVVRWRSDASLNTAWDTQTRCKAVSARFQQYYQDGRLNLITHGIMNRQQVICVTNNYGGSCTGILYTLRSTDDPEVLVEQLRDILNGRSRSVINENSGALQLYIEVDIDEFIRTAPIEEDPGN